MSEHLERFARRVESEPGFWSGVLVRHRQLLGLTEDQQADLLHINRTGLTRLALCGLPRPECHAEDLRRIADHVGTDLEVLPGTLFAVA